MTAALKVQPGDLVLVQAAAMSGIYSGYYTVQEIGLGGVNVLSIGARSVLGNSVRVQLEDIVAVFRPDFLRLERLPKGTADVSRARPPAPKPQPKPEPEPEKTVFVSVPDARKQSVQMVRFKTADRAQQDVLMPCFQTDHKNRYSESRLAIEVPADMVERLLANTENYYVIPEPDQTRIRIAKQLEQAAAK